MLLCANVVYVIQRSYNVFIVDGGFLYLVNTAMFAAIPYYQCFHHVPMRTVKLQRGSPADDDDVITPSANSNRGCNGHYGDGQYASSWKPSHN